eukprot:GHVU01078165.1.p1 GENE.GHVU01078165.1~~GHVU01078165.1.p1  ORF type:complete len:243 (-),score=26.02 GHVU01078165.1:1102-1830(-)
MVIRCGVTTARGALAAFALALLLLSSQHCWAERRGESNQAAAPVATSTIKGTISQTDAGAGAVIQVDGGRFIGVSNVDGSFLIPNVPLGGHLLEVTHPRHRFGPIFVTVRSGAPNTAHIYSPLEGATIHKLPYPLSLTPEGHMEYFHVRSLFDYKSLLKNPLVIMGVITLIMMGVLPVLQKGMDQEDVRTMQRMTGADVAAFESEFVAALPSSSVSSANALVAGGGSSDSLHQRPAAARASG